MLNNVGSNAVFFNAKFESGNLRQVFKLDHSKLKRDEKRTMIEDPLSLENLRTMQHFVEYNLYLQDDSNSDNSLTQWFYFSCMNIKKGTILKVNMVNLMKDDSLYSQGMRPFVYSYKRHKEGDGVQWHREGFNIDYYYNEKTIRTNPRTLDMEFDPSFVSS